MWQDYFVCDACTCHPLYKLVFLLKCTVQFCLVISLDRLEIHIGLPITPCIYFVTTVLRHTGGDLEEQWIHNWPKSSNITELPIERSVWGSKRWYCITWIQTENYTTYWKYTDVLSVTFKRQSTRFSFSPNNNEKLIGIKTRQDISKYYYDLDKYLKLQIIFQIHLASNYNLRLNVSKIFYVMYLDNYLNTWHKKPGIPR